MGGSTSGQTGAVAGASTLVRNARSRVGLSAACCSGRARGPESSCECRRSDTGRRESVSETLGERLRRYHLPVSLSQENLAERAGLSAHGISDLERGARNRLYRDTVQGLASARRESCPPVAV
jgi:hypothetical protein